MDSRKEAIACSDRTVNGGCQTRGVQLHLQLDVLRFTYILQAKSPLLQFLFVSFLHARRKVLREMFVGRLDQGLGEFVSVVHLLHLTQARSLAETFFEGGIDCLGVLEHELFGERTTARLDVGTLVHVLENVGPDTALVAGIVDISSVAKPRGDLLQKQHRCYQTVMSENGEDSPFVTASQCHV